ncbi:hypothetical protein LQ327_06050 [Actinomycetospora endophytica]|uniref:PrgI family protein n=1 Tax=Actinomycetospora endophytica TaxID=2291215 RepID=A0ABS8P3X9_9PSEU|nr:hypothetical protein [Actinomycetospora endophytica]MCD2192951.1 hypothetical protein [Actinomycetospora endophytica]
MQIRTDDDVYRVDAVWLGPPRATFPWRARYSSYGVGLIVMIVVMFFQRRLGIPIGFFSVAWALLITVVVVRFVAKRIDEDRPLLQWLTLFVHELRGPRRRTRGEGSTVGTGHVAIEAARPRRALPAGRTDPHAAMATVSDARARTEDRRGPDDEAGSGRRPGDGTGTRRRRTPRRSWTTRGGARAEPPPSTPREPTVTADDDDVDGVLHVTARRADRSQKPKPKPKPRRPRTRPVSGPRRFGPSAQSEAPTTDATGTGPDRHDEEDDGAAPARS